MTKKPAAKRRPSKGLAAARAAAQATESAAFKEGRAAALANQGIHTNPYKSNPDRLDWANGYFAQGTTGA